MAPPTLNGPSVAPASGGPARQLVVFLHGVGADGNDLIGMAPFFAELLPDAEFIAPDAPFPCDLAAFGRQWFSLRDTHPMAILDGIRVAAPMLDAFLDQELARRGLTERDLALVGFSQGTMMSLFVALRRASPCAAIVGYSGLLAAPERLPEELTVRPPVLLVHGQDDDVVPHAFLPLARDALRLMDVPVHCRSLADVGHEIDDSGLAAGIRFVARGFGFDQGSEFDDEFAENGT